MITAEEATDNLYNLVRGTKYVPSAYWTTHKEFKLGYQQHKPKFVLDTTLVPPRGIEPQLPVPQTSVLSIIR